MQIFDILLAWGAQVSRREVFASISITRLPRCRGHGAELGWMENCPGKITEGPWSQLSCVKGLQTPKSFTFTFTFPPLLSPPLVLVKTIWMPYNGAAG